MAKLRFRDRAEAGQLLANQLREYAHQSDVLILALPRGGVPVAYEISRVLQVPLDLCLVRKLGVPGHEELAMGAIASNGIRVTNETLLRSLSISEQVLAEVTAAEQKELERRDWAYRGNRAVPDVRDRTIILVDDGIATGATLRAAIALLKQQAPRRIVVAVPIAPPLSCEALKLIVDQVVCLAMPKTLSSIGEWYEDFSQTTDQQVCQLLGRSFPTPSE
ncbi:MAG: phosphoribosyltransferase [Leptolyngbyaceae cyanobacterium CRU_2_3]|nr:phosphoribosyltransferase [Leptolyngbyaceae cyanobacterium CRU_2_3]